jgi:hypothetical protein
MDDIVETSHVSRLHTSGQAGVQWPALMTLLYNAALGRRQISLVRLGGCGAGQLKY